MLEVHSADTQSVFILSPNRSMSWQTNKKILLSMFVVNMIIGLSFAYLGAWMILPFAGLEIGLVAIATYYVCWKLNSKETISVEAQSFTLQKGVYYPSQTWHWQTSNIRVLKQPSNYRLSPPTLYLKHLNQQVEIGHFLNLNDKKELLSKFKSMGLPIVLLDQRHS